MTLESTVEDTRTAKGQATAEMAWDAPGPGPWVQDRAHFPMAATAMLQSQYPANFALGFSDGFAPWGGLLDTVSMRFVNGFSYVQPVPFDAPGPDGPPSHDGIVAEIGRRTGLAAAAFEQRIWRDALGRWEAEVKPAATAKHRGFGDRDLTTLSTAELRDHLHGCIEHFGAMWRQHHTFNMMAMVPVGDFMLHTAGWTGRDPGTIFTVLDGFSPVSSVLPPEIEAAIDAISGDREARALLAGTTPADECLAALSARVPAVAEVVASMGFRLAAGFDITNPTIRERPDVVLGRLRAALDHDPETSKQRADALAAELRAEVPEQHRAEFDELLAEARLMYRLRDERGLYSDSAGAGLVRLALIELGRRLHAEGRIAVMYDALDLTPTEVDALLDGSPAPSAAELSARVANRKAVSRLGAPRFLGDAPPPPPPPLDGLPAPLARLMGAFGFMFGGIVGEIDSPMGDADTIVGIPGSAGTYEGIARIVRNFDDLQCLEDGEVLVTPATGEAFNSFLHIVGAIVTDHGSFASHAAIMGREMGFPTVVGAVNATSRIPTGARVRVDGASGTVTVIDLS